MTGKRKAPPEERVYTAFHLFCGIGGGSLGFAAARAELGHLVGRVVNIGGIDSDPSAIRDYARLTKSDGTVIDLFERADYTAFHGKPPPDDWREATPADILAAAGGQCPDIVFLSPPCTSFSGLLPRKRAGEAKYQALSRLVVRGLFLAMEAFAASLPKLIILENVPRIRQRGADLIARNIAMLTQYGYAVQTADHDCGEIGETGAHRWRFLMVARHMASVPPFLYEPPRKKLRTLGDVILRLPLPFDPAAGPMHTLPNLKFATWLRLALIPPGSDWRALEKWKPGSFRIGRTPFSNVLCVIPCDEPAPTVTAGGTPTSGGYSVADVRLSESPDRHPIQYAVSDPDEPARTVTGSRVGSGGMVTVDPRVAPSANRHTTKYQVGDPEKPARTVTGTMDVQAGAMSISDVRMSLPANSVTLRVRDIDKPAATIPSRSGPWDSGGQAVPDPRVQGVYRGGTLGVAALDAPGKTVIASADLWTPGDAAMPEPRIGGAFAGTYGVLPLGEPAGVVTCNARESTGAFSVAEVRVAAAHHGSYGVNRLDAPAGAVTGGAAVSTGRFSVGDVRVGGAFEHSYDVAELGQPSGAVTGRAEASTGRFSAPDVRIYGAFNGAFGVQDPGAPGGAVTGESWPSNGANSVAEPRLLSIRPAFWPDDLPIILSPHTGCMHRPLTTLELFALQGFLDVLGFDPSNPPWLDGRSVARWRTAIGNAVPPPAARAVAQTMLMTLLAAELAQQPLPSTPVWVQGDMPLINQILRVYAPDEYGVAV